MFNGYLNGKGILIDPIGGFSLRVLDVFEFILVVWLKRQAYTQTAFN